MIDREDSGPVGSLIVRSLDEEQARERAFTHSCHDRRSWRVVRTPAGLHVCLPNAPTPLLPDGYSIVTTYRDGKEV